MNKKLTVQTEKESNGRITNIRIFSNDKELNSDYLRKLSLIGCLGSYQTLEATLDLFSSGAFSIEEIMENLDSDDFVPFVDFSIKIAGIETWKLKDNESALQVYGDAQKKMFNYYKRIKKTSN